MSQGALAEALGLTFQQVQNHEREADRLSASKRLRTAQKLDTTVVYLVNENDTEQHTHDIHSTITALAPWRCLKLIMS
jgi:transcriptional regulator with XRE-family HTH domain